jgi:hypothetical protein
MDAMQSRRYIAHTLEGSTFRTARPLKILFASPLGNRQRLEGGSISAGFWTSIERRGPFMIH